MFVYWFCIISRISSVSRLLPPLDGTLAGGTAQVLGTSAWLGPVNVELAVLFQSTWNFHTSTVFRKHHTEVNRFGRPAGGAPVCCRALRGSSVNGGQGWPPPIFDTLNEPTSGEAAPASIWARLNDHTVTC